VPEGRREGAGWGVGAWGIQRLVGPRGVGECSRGSWLGILNLLAP